MSLLHGIQFLYQLVDDYNSLTFQSIQKYFVLSRYLQTHRTTSATSYSRVRLTRVIFYPKQKQQKGNRRSAPPPEGCRKWPVKLWHTCRTIINTWKVSNGTVTPSWKIFKWVLVWDSKRPATKQRKTCRNLCQIPWSQSCELEMYLQSSFTCTCSCHLCFWCKSHGFDQENKKNSVPPSCQSKRVTFFSLHENWELVFCSQSD